MIGCDGVTDAMLICRSTFKFSTDPTAEENLRCCRPVFEPSNNAIVLSVDEKTHSLPGELSRYRPCRPFASPPDARLQTEWLDRTRLGRRKALARKGPVLE